MNPKLKLNETEQIEFAALKQELYQRMKTVNGGNNLFLSLSLPHYGEFLRGDGGELGRMHLAYSSSALFYNMTSFVDTPAVITLMGDCFHGIRYEEKLQTIKPKGEKEKPMANIDGYLLSSDTHLFIESKFLEAFEAPKDKYESEGYLDPSRYRIKDEATIAKWTQMFKQTHDQYFDSKQILKHMLAIYSDLAAEPGKYLPEGNIILISLMFRLEQDTKFKLLLEYQNKVFEEAERFESIFNHFLKEMNLFPVRIEYKVMDYQEYVEETDLENKTPELYKFYLARYAGI